ncbi:MAG TPA: oxygenase MpaB family protein [Streptosporangiaceae bacterium]|nr:oxygenase MpaB family protein [Streptosporangiaceae bacterium]
MNRTGRSPEPLGAGSLMWDIAGEYRTLLIVPSALLLQVAHPAVGAAVAQHSCVSDDAWGRAIRTGNSMLRYIYGGPLAVAEGQRLRALHRSFRGTDELGRPYHALNGAAYAWVNLTLFERYVTVRRLFGRPLTESQQSQLYAESRQLGSVLAVPEREMPATLQDFRRYFRDMVENGLENTAAAHAMLAELRKPQRPPALPDRLESVWPLLSKALGRVSYLLALGTVAPEVRELLGQRWTRVEQLELDALAASVRAGHLLLPERLRYMREVMKVRSGERRPAPGPEAPPADL